MTRSLPPALILLTLLSAPVATGADLTPVKPMDAGSTDGLIHADPAARDLTLGLHLYQARGVRLNPGKTAPLQKSGVLGRGSMLAGYALSGFGDWHLGLHWNGENDRLRDNAGRAYFEAVTLMGKFHLWNTGTFAGSLGVFGEHAPTRTGPEGSFTRETGNNRAGWLVAVRAGNGDPVNLHLTTGMRYRKPERWQNHMLRNEFIYQATLEAPVHPSAGLFTSLNGRNLKMAPVSDSLEYTGSHLRSYRAGINLMPDTGLKVSLYGGRDASPGALGHGRKIVGMGLSYVPGAAGPEKAPEKTAKDINAWPLDEDKLPKGNYDYHSRYLDETLKDKEQKASAKEMDDFHFVEEKMKQEKAAAGGKESEDEIFERELKKLRHAEALRKANEEKRQRLEDEVERQTISERMKNNTELRKQFEEEIREDLDKLPVITDDEVNWNGLD